MEYVYNASIIRFRPYRDIGEFINVGIIVAFPQFGRIICKFENKVRRISAFFPEVDTNLFRQTLKSMADYLAQNCDKKIQNEENCEYDFFYKDSNELFIRITEIQEGILIFSPIITGISSSINEKAGSLFEYYVQRNFKTQKTTPEERLEASFKKTLQQFNLHRNFKPGVLGNSIYNVKIPFYNQNLLIRTLCFKRDPVDLFEYSDQWVSRVDRLQRMDLIKAPMLFPIEYPVGEAMTETKQNAIDEFNEKISKFHLVKIVPVTENAQIIDFIHRNII